jgi:hypothetical protein
VGAVLLAWVLWQEDETEAHAPLATGAAAAADGLPERST